MTINFDICQNDFGVVNIIGNEKNITYIMILVMKIQ